ncbi:unnamed protein product [Phaeothamnion confervicola]
MGRSLCAAALLLSCLLIVPAFHLAPRLPPRKELTCKATNERGAAAAALIILSSFQLGAPLTALAGDAAVERSPFMEAFDRVKFLPIISPEEREKLSRIAPALPNQADAQRVARRSLQDLKMAPADVLLGHEMPSPPPPGRTFNPTDDAVAVGKEMVSVASAAASVAADAAAVALHAVGLDDEAVATAAAVAAVVSKPLPPLVVPVAPSARLPPPAVAGRWARLTERLVAAVDRDVAAALQQQQQQQQLQRDDGSDFKGFNGGGGSADFSAAAAAAAAEGSATLAAAAAGVVNAVGDAFRGESAVDLLGLREAPVWKDVEGIAAAASEAEAKLPTAEALQSQIAESFKRIEGMTRNIETAVTETASARIAVARSFSLPKPPALDGLRLPTELPVRKLWPLPAVPSLPSLPSLLTLPVMPALPSMPAMPAHPAIPAVPAVDLSGMLGSAPEAQQNILAAAALAVAAVGVAGAAAARSGGTATSSTAPLYPEAASSVAAGSTATAERRAASGANGARINGAAPNEPIRLAEPAIMTTDDAVVATELLWNLVRESGAELAATGTTAVTAAAVATAAATVYDEVYLPVSDGPVAEFSTAEEAEDETEEEEEEEGAAVEQLQMSVEGSSSDADEGAGASSDGDESGKGEGDDLQRDLSKLRREVEGLLGALRGRDLLAESRQLQQQISSLRALKPQDKTSVLQDAQEDIR